MTSKPSHPVISEALYFDTNALRQLSHGIDHVEFLNLRQVSERIGLRFFAPEVVIMEWMRQIEREVNDNLAKIKNASRDIGRLLSCDPIQYKEPDTVFDKVEDTIRNYLESAEIEVIPTPNIPLKTIIEMAVNKKPPFEEKGEKGFRDTIIFFTILNHLKTIGITNAVLVSADAIFYNRELIEIYKKEELNVSVVKTISDAKNLLEAQIDQVTDFYIEEKKQNIRSFLNTKFEEIVEYILRNAEVSENFLKGRFDKEQNDMIGVSKIKKIVDVRPKEISNIFPGLIFSEKVIPKGTEPITFSVSCEFDLLVDQYGLDILVSSPRVKLSESIAFDQIPYNYPKPREVQITIVRIVTIEALMLVEDGHPVNLSLDRIITY